ncbi:MAG: hypothetical protein K6C05_03320 [Anaerovibrio sp.]|nr:hypothetical protein [Anaerovibrio sp.]
MLAVILFAAKDTAEGYGLIINEETAHAASTAATFQIFAFCLISIIFLLFPRIRIGFLFYLILFNDILNNPFS